MTECYHDNDTLPQRTIVGLPPRGVDPNDGTSVSTPSARWYASAVEVFCSGMLVEATRWWSGLKSAHATCVTNQRRVCLGEETEGQPLQRSRLHVWYVRDPEDFTEWPRVQSIRWLNNSPRDSPSFRTIRQHREDTRSATTVLRPQNKQLVYLAAGQYAHTPNHRLRSRRL